MTRKVYFENIFWEQKSFFATFRKMNNLEVGRNGFSSLMVTWEAGKCKKCRLILNLLMKYCNRTYRMQDVLIYRFLDGTFHITYDISKTLHELTCSRGVSQFIYTKSRFSSIMVLAIFKTNLSEVGIKIGFWHKISAVVEVC